MFGKKSIGNRLKSAKDQNTKKEILVRNRY